MKNDELVQAYLSLEALFLLVRSVIQRYQTSPFFSLLQRVVLQVGMIHSGGRQRLLLVDRRWGGFLFLLF